MQTETHNSSARLRLLAGFTALTLLAIIGLQAYWLATSYKQQKSRFSADIENAIMAASVKFTLAQPAANRQDSLPASVSDIITMALKKASGNAIISANSNITIHIDDRLNNSIIHDNDSLPQNKKKAESLFADREINFIPEKRLALFKKALDVELIKRSIVTPYHLAVFDPWNHFITATCDTTIFKSMPLKYTGKVSFISHGNLLQVAFSNANVYLIKRMAWLLSVTLLLITVCALSFSYLVVLFFRQKKFADIRNDFLNNMTHELKTPISTVSVAIELMQDKRRPLDEHKKEEFLSIAQGELKRLTLLVEKVLKMAAFEKSEITVTAGTFPVSPWLQDVLIGCKPLFEASGAEVETAVKPESLIICADKTHLTNVLQNLLENAIKYNDKKKPKIVIRLHESGACVELTVSDNGRGIPAAYLEKVFDKFFRVPSGDLHTTKGYGLGLSYVKAIVELHGGSVAAHSTKEEGSTFVIRLPKLEK